MSTSSECSSIYSTGGWLKFFSDAGVQQDVRGAYSAAFVENRIERSMLKELNKEMLQDMGIKPIGDIILILRHIKELSNEEALEKMTTGMGCSNVNVAKVRPQTSVNIGDHSKASVTPAERGDEPSESTARPTVTRVLQKVPRPQTPLQKNQRSQTTSVNNLPGNSRQGVVKNVAKVGMNAVSCTSKCTSTESNVTAKPRQVSSASKTQSITSLGRGVITKPKQLFVVRKTESIATVTSSHLQLRSKGVEQHVEDTLSEEQEANASSSQNTKSPAVQIKNSVTPSTNTKKVVSLKSKLVSSDMKKSVLVSKSESSRNLASGSTGGASTLQTKSILKKSGYPLKIHSASKEQLKANTSGPMIVRNFKLHTETVDSNDSLPTEDDSNAEQTSIVSSTNTSGNSATQNADKGQRVVRRPTTWPVVDNDDSDSLTNDESCVTYERVSRGSKMNQNTLQTKPISNSRVGCLSTSGESAEAGSSFTTGVNVSQSASLKTKVISLRSVHSKSESPSAPKVRRLPPEYEGAYRIIMPKGWMPNKLPAWKQSHSHKVVGSRNCDEKVAANETENVLFGDEQGDGEEYAEEENFVVNEEEEEEEVVEEESNEFDEELEEELYNQLDEEINKYRQPGINDIVPQRRAASVFDRLGWHSEEDSKPASVFSRLGRTRRIINQPYQVRYVHNIRQRAYDTLRRKMSPETQTYTRSFFRKQGPAKHLLVRKKRPNMPAESNNLGVPVSHSNRKTVRFGVKEELHFDDTPEEEEEEEEEEEIYVEEAPRPHLPRRKPLPGSITLRTGIFNNLGI